MNEDAKTTFCAESPFHKHVAIFYRKPSWEQNEASLPPPESASIASIGCILRGSPGPRTSDEEALLASHPINREREGRGKASWYVPYEVGLARGDAVLLLTPTHLSPCSFPYLIPLSLLSLREHAASLHLLGKRNVTFLPRRLDGLRRKEGWQWKGGKKTGLTGMDGISPENGEILGIDRFCLPPPPSSVLRLFKFRNKDCLDRGGIALLPNFEQKRRARSCDARGKTSLPLPL